MKNLENTSTKNSRIEKANESKRYNVYIKDVSEIAVEDFKMFMKIDELFKGYGRQMNVN